MPQLLLRISLYRDSDLEPLKHSSGGEQLPFLPLCLSRLLSLEFIRPSSSWRERGGLGDSIGWPQLVALLQGTGGSLEGHCSMKA